MSRPHGASQRPAGTRRRFPAGRILPDLLLALLAVAAPGLALAAGTALAAAAAVWALLAVGVAAAAAVRRERSPEGDAEDGAGRDLRLLAVGVAGAHAATAAAVAAGAPADAAALARLGACAAALTVAAARVPRRWAAPALAALAAALEAGQAVAAPAPAAARGALASAAALAALAGAAAWAFSWTRRERAELRSVIDEHQRLHGEAEKLRERGVERREPELRNLTPEGRRARALSAVVYMDRNLDRVLGLAKLSVGARSVALFLLADAGERLRLRRVVEGEGTTFDRDATPALGEGVVGRVAETGRAALFTNLGAESLRPPLYVDETPVPSLVAVPVFETGVVRGVLLADAAAPGAFAREGERLLEGFADEVGSLLAEASAAASRAKLGDRFETLAAISRELSSTIKIEDLLGRLLVRTGEIAPYDRSALFVVGDDGRSLRLLSQRGFLAEEAGEPSIPLDHGLAGFVATLRSRVSFSDLARRGPAIEIVPGSPGQERIRSFLGLPLQTPEGLLGVWVLAAEQPERFSSEQIDILTIVAAQSATLISNAMLHQKVDRMSVSDGLTDLYNHRRFQERLQEEVERAERHGEQVSLLLLDIDHFKKINDTHGHPFGDTVLKALAAELKRLARRVDFVARYGGEEFAIILVNTGPRGCATGARRVVRAVRALRVPREGGAFQFTLSVGAATFPDDARTREELVRNADRALYAAKRGGRDRAVAFRDLPPGDAAAEAAERAGAPQAQPAGGDGR